MTSPLLVGSRKGLFIMEPEHTGWRTARHEFHGSPVTAVLRDPRDGALYAGLALGHFGVKLHRSDDGGASWTELKAPGFPEGFPADEGRAAPAVSLLWILEAGGADQPGLIWAGTIPGALFRSADRGESWSLVESLWNQPSRTEWFGGGYDDPGIHSIAVDPRDSRRMAVGISCGGVWLTEDGAESWRPGRGMIAGYMPPQRAEDPTIQDPHRVVRCPGAPERLWTQHHSGVFRSDDGGAAWTRITGLPVSDFGFAVAVHPRDPDTAWFVPAKSDETRIPVDGRFGISRTTDGGRSFERVEAGLPPAPAYDLVYRHALDVAPDGRSLAMGSTTGSLWTTTDAGRSWRMESAHLPPIACVRFAA